MEEFGKFPWGEIFINTLSVVMAYFTGRYRRVHKDVKTMMDDERRYTGDGN